MDVDKYNIWYELKRIADALEKIKYVQEMFLGEKIYRRLQEKEAEDEQAGTEGDGGETAD